MSNEDKKPEVQDSAKDVQDSAKEDHIAKTDYKEIAIKTAYNIAESTILIVGEASKFISNVSFAGAQKVKELAEKRGSKTDDAEVDKNSSNKGNSNTP